MSPDGGANRLTSIPVTGAGAPTRVLVVDDHLAVAEGVVRILDAAPDLEVVSVAHTVAEAVRASEVEPDLVLLDYQLPDGDGVEATGHLLARHPGLKILLFTGRIDPAVLRDAIGAGACGLVPKTASGAELVDAVRRAASGATVAPRSLLRAALDTGGAGAASVTQRELEVLRLLAKGRSSVEIAEELVVSLNTVRNHIQRLLHKLGAHSRHEAVAVGVREGLLRR